MDNSAINLLESAIVVGLLLLLIYLVFTFILRYKYVRLKQVIPYKYNGLKFNLDTISLKKNKLNILYNSTLKVSLDSPHQDKFYYKLNSKDTCNLVITESVPIYRVFNGDIIILYYDYCEPYIRKVLSIEKDCDNMILGSIDPKEEWKEYFSKENYSKVDRVIYTSILTI